MMTAKCLTCDMSWVVPFHMDDHIGAIGGHAARHTVEEPGHIVCLSGPATVEEYLEEGGQL